MALLRRLRSDGFEDLNPPKINPNLVANCIIKMSRAPLHKQFTTDLSKLKKEAARKGTIFTPFTLDEINTVIFKFKTGKSAGIDFS